MDATRLALLLLRTNTAAHSRQRRRHFEHLGSLENFSAFDVLDKRRNVDAHGATLHTSRVRTVQTTLRLRHRLLKRQSRVHFLRAGRGTILRVQFVHHTALNRRPFLRLHRRTQRYAPLAVAVGQGFDGLRVFLFGCGVTYRLGSLFGHDTFHVLLQFLHLLLFNVAESTHALEHLVEIHLVAVKFRTIDADELRLSAHRDAARTAHARTIDHDGVQAHVGWYIIFLRQQTAELHHDGRTDGEALVHVFALNHLLHAHGHYTLLAITAVVGHDYDFVRIFTHLFFQDDQFLRTSGQHRDHAVARLLERLDDGQHRSNAHAATSAEHCAVAFDVGSLAERTHHVGDVVACVQPAQFGRRVADRLHHQRNRSLHRVAVCNRERDAFALLAHTHDDEVAGTARTGNQRRLDHQFEYFLGKLFFTDNSVHKSYKFTKNDAKVRKIINKQQRIADKLLPKSVHFAFFIKTGNVRGHRAS